MKRNLSELWQMASLYCCAIIGAGFATGKEIQIFFGKYGQAGLVCIGLMSVLLAALGLLAVKKGNGGTFINLVFQPIMFFVMVAAGGTLLGKIIIFKSNSIFLGCLIFAAICGVLLMFDLKGVASISKWATPVLLLGILVICVRWAFVSPSGIPALHVPRVSFGSCLSAVWAMLLYIGYNYMVPASLIHEYVSSKKGFARKGYWYAGAVLGGVIVSALAMVIFVALGKVIAVNGDTEMPLLSAAAVFGELGTKVYFSLLLVAVFSSAASSGQNVVSLVSRVFKLKRGYSLVIALALSVLLAQLGFSWLVSNLYPIMGIGGLILIVKSSFT